jgi:hypothetical protein
VPYLTNTGKSETKHQQMRFGLAGLNGSFTPEEQMMRVANTRQSALFLAHGGEVHLRGYLTGQGFRRVINGDFVKSMVAKTCSSKTYADDAYGEDDVEAALSMAADVKKPSQSSVTKVSGVVNIQSILRDREVTRQLLLCVGVSSSVQNYDINELPSSIGVKAYSWIEPGHRPPYCRRIAVNRYYTVAVKGPVACGRVGRVTSILKLSERFWARINWVEELDRVDRQTGLVIVRLSDQFEIRPADDVLEPRHIVHLCDKTCNTLGPGFMGSHGDRNEFLDNENIAVG